MSRMIVIAAAVSTAITLLAAFFLFGRRRRGEDADRTLATAAATVYGAAPPASAPSSPIPARTRRSGAPASGDPAPAIASEIVAAPLVDPGTGGTDINLPRWRRPSLMAARLSDPVRNPGPVADAAHLTFEPGDPSNAERRTVRYRIVRLLDRPDELTGSTVGSLDEGDEVEIVGQSGLYRRVRTPDGRSGWLHKMTLGEELAASSEPDLPVDPDVLLAYLAARGRN